MEKDLTLIKALAKTYSRFPFIPKSLKIASLAQWILESGWGSSELAKKHYNFGGLKYRTQMVPYAHGVEYEAHDGTAEYCHFQYLEQFIHGYWAFIQRSPYAGWQMYTRTSEEFIKFIGPTYVGTSKGQEYVEKIVALFPSAEKLLDGK